MIAELQSQLAQANQLATQGREFAGDVRKANGNFSVENQRLKMEIERHNEDGD
jgi:hypothetical protein